MCDAKYGTWRAEDKVFYVAQKDVLQSEPRVSVI